MTDKERNQKALDILSTAEGRGEAVIRLVRGVGIAEAVASDGEKVILVGFIDSRGEGSFYPFARVMLPTEIDKFANKPVDVQGAQGIPLPKKIVDKLNKMASDGGLDGLPLPQGIIAAIGGKGGFEIVTDDEDEPSPKPGALLN